MNDGMRNFNNARGFMLVTVLFLITVVAVLVATMSTTVGVQTFQACIHCNRRAHSRPQSADWSMAQSVQSAPVFAQMAVSRFQASTSVLR